MKVSVTGVRRSSTRGVGLCSTVVSTPDSLSLLSYTTVSEINESLLPFLSEGSFVPSALPQFHQL